MDYLVVVEPQGVERRIDLSGDEYLIGRDPELPIALPHPKVSRRHARLFRANGSLWIEDLGSSNGVIVDGQLIRQAYRLNALSVIDISGFRIKFHGTQPLTTQHYTLVGKSPSVSHQRFALASSQVRVGRGSDNALVIDDASISRHHAVISLDSGVTVEDLQSSNGTFVNGARITRHSLQNNDEVRFGTVVYTLTTNQAKPAQIAWKDLQKVPRLARLLGFIITLCGILLFFVVLLFLRKLPTHHPAPRQLSAQEVAYEHKVESLLTRATSQMDAQAWSLAVAAYQDVLDLDPINVEGRSGLAAAELNRVHQAALKQAAEALEKGQPARVLNCIATIGPQAFYGDVTAKLAEKARQAIGKEKAQEANKFCRRGEWRSCHENAAMLLTYLSTSTLGQALMMESEDGMRTHHIAFLPWERSSKAALANLYPDPDTREGILRYAAGDIDTALRRLRDARASGIVSLVETFRRHKTAGDGYSATGDPKRAVDAWMQALQIDVKLLPKIYPSTLGSDVRSRLTGALSRLGSEAFDRGNNVEAFRHWSKGVQVDPNNSYLGTALAKLENRATGMLAGIAAAHPDAAGCAKLREIVSITRSLHPTHQAAQDQLMRCGP